MSKDLFSVGYRRGKMDFSVSLEITKLTFKEMEELRAITIVGIGTFEDMWRREQQSKYPLANEKSS